MKKIKKVLSLLLSALILVTLIGCSTTNNSAKEADVHEEVTVAVALASVNDEYLRMQDYFNNYLGPAINVKFIFSSAITSIEEYNTFIENAVTAGATGLIDLMGGADTAAAIDAKCAEYDLPFSTWSAGAYLALDNPSGLLAGGVGSDAVQLEDASYKWAKEIFTGEGDLNLVVFSVVAFRNNSQQVPSTTGILNAINENYKLGLSEEEITELVFKDAPYEWTNGSNVNLLIAPGVPGMNIGDFDAIGAIIEEGPYDQMIIDGDVYTRFYETLDRYEEMMNRDFKVYSLAAVSDSINAGFNENDAFGNKKLQSTLMKTGSAGVFALTLVLNAMYGDNDVLGNHGVFPLSYSPITSAEAYASASKIDSSEEYYTITADEFKSMIKYYNSDLTYDSLYEKITDYSAIASVIERRGIK